MCNAGVCIVVILQRTPGMGDEDSRRNLQTALHWDERTVLPSEIHVPPLDAYVIGMSPHVLTLPSFERLQLASLLDNPR